MLKSKASVLSYVGDVAIFDADGRLINSSGKWPLPDIGVAFTGAADVRLNVTCDMGNPALCAQLADDVAAEEAELQRDADDVKYWPVLSLGVSYKF